MNLNDKTKYVFHITLQFYLKHGLKLKKIHRAKKFERQEILEPYIEFYTEEKYARNDFGKIHLSYYMMLFWKTWKIVSDERRFMKRAKNPSFKHSHIINDNRDTLVGVEKQKPN